MIYSLSAAGLLGLTAILYLLLLFNIPLGEFVMGGRHKVLTRTGKATAAVAIVIQVFGILAVLQGGGIISTCLSDRVVKIGCFIFAAYLSLNTVMNALSKSRKEKKLMTPLSLLTAICFWVVALRV